MGYFPVRYNSRVVIYKHKMFIRLATGFDFFKWANPGLFFVYLQSFQTNITIFTTNICEKNVHPVYGAGIRTHDLRNVSLFP